MISNLGIRVLHSELRIFHSISIEFAFALLPLSFGQFTDSIRIHFCIRIGDIELGHSHCRRCTSGRFTVLALNFGIHIVNVERWYSHS